MLRLAALRLGLGWRKQVGVSRSVQIRLDDLLRLGADVDDPLAAVVLALVVFGLVFQRIENIGPNGLVEILVNPLKLRRTNVRAVRLVEGHDEQE